MQAAPSQLPRIEDFDEPGYDPHTDDRLTWGDEVDPYPRLAELQRRTPVVEGDYRSLFATAPGMTGSKVRTFMALGYDAAKEALMNPEIYSNKFYDPYVLPTFGRSITVMDAPEHGRYRRIFQKAFLPSAISKWGESIVQPVVDELIGKFARRGTAELVSEFTQVYPFEIIYRKLNMPRDHVQTFRRLGTALNSFAVDPSKGLEASAKLGRYFEALIEDRRRNPGDDLISTLVTAEIDGEVLPLEILVAFLRQLLNAGGDSTYRSTSSLIVALLQNPDQLDALRQDRSLLPGAIEEVMRWDGPVGVHGRLVTRDTVLGGVQIPKGSIVEVMAMAAGRDETKFTDPHKFNIFRKVGAVRHMAFSAGPHLCLGQHLARLEMTCAVSGLLDRLPHLRIDPDKPQPEIRGMMMRFPNHIHVRFDAQGLQ
jgi:cytochrome P450